jgi:hypothetical protein
MIQAACHACRRRLPASHAWLVVPRGAPLPDGTRAATDRRYCCPTCWAADLTAPATQETTAP